MHRNFPHRYKYVYVYVHVILEGKKVVFQALNFVGLIHRARVANVM